MFGTPQRTTISTSFTTLHDNSELVDECGVSIKEEMEEEFKSIDIANCGVSIKEEMEEKSESIHMANCDVSIKEETEEELESIRKLSVL
ncbi:unnamed protein product [Nezara viridula]|uniref:Uncharacterized protein n=1 Tax=Nezara viridula TaxID=85310 RepID=A0A9P0H024_NEZVI|nr:unnamed protein product [Nezara viridula]